MISYSNWFYISCQKITYSCSIHSQWNVCIYCQNLNEKELKVFQSLNTYSIDLISYSYASCGWWNQPWSLCAETEEEPHTRNSKWAKAHRTHMGCQAGNTNINIKTDWQTWISDIRWLFFNIQSTEPAGTALNFASLRQWLQTFGFNSRVFPGCSKYHVQDLKGQFVCILSW